MKKATKFFTVALAILLLAVLLCACGVTPTGYADDITSDSIISKQPIGETLEAGGSAIFTAYASGQSSVNWFFREPGRNSEYSASDLHFRFPRLIIEGHNTERLTLTNIPREMDGWSAFAVFTSSDGTRTESDEAFLWIKNPAIRITKHPYDENNVVVGSSTSFIAHADNATSVTWYATKDNITVLASELSSTYCPGLTLYDYDKEKLIIHNAPFSVSGWRFFACFDGENGPVYSNKAIITVVEPICPEPICPPRPCNPPHIIIGGPCAPHSSTSVTVTTDTTVTVTTGGCR